MSSYETSGRTNQKRRTRMALIATATEMVRAGKTPTVAEVAETALISKSTAYRYFPSQELLLVEVRLDEVVRQELDAAYAAAEGPGTPAERLDAVMRADLAMQLRHEDAVRNALRSWVARDGTGDESRVRRPGNRLRYISTAIEAERERLGDERFDRLVMSLAMCAGIESVIVLKDICGLNDEAVAEVKRWAASALLDAAVREAG